MDREATASSWIALLETRDRLMSQLRHDVPAVWPGAIAAFLCEVKGAPEPLPSGVTLLLLADLVRELDRLAPGGPSHSRMQRLLVVLEQAAGGTAPADVLCHQLQDALRPWY